ncbi:MAG: TolC family protein, partial [Gemmataceae bacterium]
MLFLAAEALTPLTGCGRAFFRHRADEEVSEVLAQKDRYPEWAIENWHAYADPRARFADCSDPDHPAKPPDDPAAYFLSPNPQKPGKAGVARIEGTGYLELIAEWDQENRARRSQEEAAEKAKMAETSASEEQQEPPPFAPNQDRPKQAPPKVEGPKVELPSAVEKGAAAGAENMPGGQRDALAEAKAPSQIDISGRPTYLLTLDQAAELAMFNSREYQDQRENLYLAALPVTTERFSFMGQLFAASQAARHWAGPTAPGGPTDNWVLNNGIGVSKVLPSAGLLLFNASNQTVFNFLQPKTTTNITTLNFSAIQPLLRGGGRAVALEGLTQSERSLLYQIRRFARFRKELYVAIASNSGGSISGSAFQPVGVLSNNGISANVPLGNSGLQPGSTQSLSTTLNGSIVPPASPGQLALAGAITPPPSGYLNTMLQKIQVYIDQENVDVLSDILLRFRGLLEGDVVGPLQVQSVEQQLLAGRSALLADQQQYLVAINGFKLEIGVPMELNIELDDAVLKPLLDQFRRSRSIIENEQAAVAAVSKLIPLENAPRLRGELLRQFQTSALVRNTAFAKTIRARWAEWEKLSNADLVSRLESHRKEAQKLLDLEADLQHNGQHLSPADQARLKRLNAEFDLGNFERALRLYESNYVVMGKPKPPDGTGERQRIRQFQGVVSSWQKVLVEPRDEQWVVVRSNWPELPRCCLDGLDLIRVDLDKAQEAAGHRALDNRLDLMNTRAQLVDAWRQMAIYANALLGTFTAQYNLTATSPPGGTNSSAHQLILNTQLPLTRIQERNNYRASLIAYQRQRRNLQEAEDLAVQNVQNEIYQLRLYADQYRLQQRQLELAYLTIDSALESLQAPTAPPPPPGIARTGGV